MYNCKNLTVKLLIVIYLCTRVFSSLYYFHSMDRENHSITMKRYIFISVKLVSSTLCFLYKTTLGNVFLSLVINEKSFLSQTKKESVQYLR